MHLYKAILISDNSPYFAQHSRINKRTIYIIFYPPFFQSPPNLVCEWWWFIFPLLRDIRKSWPAFVHSFESVLACLSITHHWIILCWKTNTFLFQILYKILTGKSCVCDKLGEVLHERQAHIYLPWWLGNYWISILLKQKLC